MGLVESLPVFVSESLPSSITKTSARTKTLATEYQAARFVRTPAGVGMVKNIYQRHHYVQTMVSAMMMSAKLSLNTAGMCGTMGS
jgi:hypothetical protein